MEATESDKRLLELLVKSNLTSWRHTVSEVSEAELASLLKDNMRMQQAVGKALAAPELWAETVQTILGMNVFIFRHNLKKDWAGWLEAALDAAPDEQSELYCRLLGRHGQMQRLLGGKSGRTKAIEIHFQALTLARTLANSILIGLMFWQLSEDHRHTKDLESAITFGQQAVYTLNGEELAPIVYVASAQVTLGLAYADNNKLDLAEKYVSRGTKLFEQNANWFEYGLGLINLGFVASRKGDAPRAQQIFKKAETVLTQIEATFNLLLLQINMASLYYHQNNYPAAKEYFLKMSTPYMLENKHEWHLAMKTHGLGDVTYMMGDPQGALPYLDEAVRRWRELDMPLRLAYTLATREPVHLDLGNVGAAEQDFREASANIARFPGHAEATQAQSVLDKWRHKRANWPYGKSGL